jgi:hypothetical protein
LKKKKTKKKYQISEYMYNFGFVFQSTFLLSFPFVLAIYNRRLIVRKLKKNFLKIEKKLINSIKKIL